MGSASPTAFTPRPDDDDDVRWALSTALVQWNRGGRADAVVWLRRAGEAAEASGAPARAEELRRHAASLAETLWSQPPGAADDIDVEVDDQGDRRAPLPPPPAAVRAIQERTHGAPSLPPLAPQNPERHSITDLEPEREHFASAPEIILDEEALDPSELEEILEYVGEDEMLEEVVPNRQSRTGQFSDRLSSASVEPLQVEALLPDIESSDDLASHSESGDRSSDTGAFDLRPSQAHRTRDQQRAPAVALPPEEEDFDDRVTVIPHGDDGDLARLRARSGIDSDGSGDEWDEAFPRSAVPAFGSSTAASATELLDGEAALDIDADLRVPYHPESIDLGADWAQVESDRNSSIGPAAPERQLEAVPITLEGAVLEESVGSEQFARDDFGAQADRAALQGADLEVTELEVAEVEATELEVADLDPAELEIAELEVAELDGGELEVAELDAEEHSVARESLPSLEFPSEPPPDRAVAVEPSQAPPTRPSAPVVSGTTVDGIELMTTRGFEDLPEEVQLRLARCARVETLRAGEEVGLFGAAVVTNGEVAVMAAFADEAGAVAQQADVVFTRGTLENSIALRVVARIDETRVAVWDPKPLAEAIEDCPWVHDELRLIADRFLARCGATLGPLGERLDDALRSTVFDRMEARTFAPGEALTVKGDPLPGLFVVGGGRVEVLAGEAVAEEMSPGDFLFATAIMGGSKSPATSRAGEQGALVLFASRSVAHELIISVPPLLEVLAG